MTMLRQLMVVIFCTSLDFIHTAPTMDRNLIKKYLMQYGYMGHKCPDKKIADLMETNEDMAITIGLKMFQMKAGLVATGDDDEATMTKMLMPRCAREDVLTMEDIPGNMMHDGRRRRRKRYSFLGDTWPRNDLTYSFSSLSGEEIPEQTVRSESVKALKTWEMVSPLTFTEIQGESDIKISFEEDDHGDGYPFDGTGTPGGSNTLAHAFAPQFGDAHFDRAEIWSSETADGTNFFQVAAHEFGHSLGLGHSENPQALMAPFYAGYQPDFALHEDDIRGIQARYGAPPDEAQTTTTMAPAQTTTTMVQAQTTTTMRPLASTTVVRVDVIPNVCAKRRLDAMTEHIRNDNERTVYAFSGDEYVVIEEGVGIVDGYPRKIADVWENAEGDLDAALTLPPVKSYRWVWTGTDWELSYDITEPAHTILFKGNTYWEYRGDDFTLVRQGDVTSRLPGLQGPITAAFVWSGNGRPYVFSDNQYYRINADMTLVEPEYPRSASTWDGIPQVVHDVFTMRHHDGGMEFETTYFVANDEIHKFNDEDFKFDSEATSLYENFQCDRFYTSGSPGPANLSLVTVWVCLVAMVMSR